eukprot:1275650-Pleurochrysis_carterae.AAC.2
MKRVPIATNRCCHHDINTFHTEAHACNDVRTDSGKLQSSTCFPASSLQYSAPLVVCSKSAACPVRLHHLIFKSVRLPPASTLTDTGWFVYARRGRCDKSRSPCDETAKELRDGESRASDGSCDSAVERERCADERETCASEACGAAAEVLEAGTRTKLANAGNEENVMGTPAAAAAAASGACASRTFRSGAEAVGNGVSDGGPHESHRFCQDACDNARTIVDVVSEVSSRSSWRGSSVGGNGRMQPKDQGRTRGLGPGRFCDAGSCRSNSSVHDFDVSKSRRGMGNLKSNQGEVRKSAKAAKYRISAEETTTLLD